MSTLFRISILQRIAVDLTISSQVFDHCCSWPLQPNEIELRLFIQFSWNEVLEDVVDMFVEVSIPCGSVLHFIDPERLIDSRCPR